MAFFNTKTVTAEPKVTLVERLAINGAALRDSEELGYQAAQNYRQAAYDAEGRAATAARQAEAVEKAVKILDEAGVEL